MKLFVSALEPSANLHLEPILKELKEYELLGIFDEKFATPLYSSSEFSVMGFFDVLPKILKAREAIKEMTFLAKDADAILLIDSPAFNLPLAKAIKKKYPNKEIIYYILPKIWAWKKRRLKNIEKYCDKLASIFPFEQKFYNKAIYVGNPLLDEISKFKNPDTTYNRVAFMPGSRKSEIKNLLPIFKEIASEIDKEKVLIIPKFFEGKDLNSLYGDISEFKISYNMQDTLSQSDFAFICSGTATLEASIIGVPFVLAYKMRKLEYLIAKSFIKLPYAGLANLIMHFENKEPIHKEFLQDDLTIENLLDAYKNFNTQQFSTSAKELKDILISGSTKNVINLL